MTLTISDLHEQILALKQEAQQSMLTSEQGHDSSYWHGYNVALDKMLEILSDDQNVASVDEDAAIT